MPFIQKPVKHTPLVDEQAHLNDLQAPSLGETFGAAFRQENLIGSFMSSPRRGISSTDFMTVEDGFNPFDDIEGYQEYEDRFEMTFNKRAADAVKASIDKERADRQTLAASGWVGTLAEVGASVADPTILLPGGAFVRGGMAGYSVARSAASVGVAAGVATGVQEAGLQATQELRTAEESGLAVGGSVLLGGLLGGAGAKLFNHLEWRRAGSVVDDAARPDFDVENDALHTELQGVFASQRQADASPQSAGAAARPLDTFDDNSIAGKAASTVANATAQLNPVLRGLTSPSSAVRRVASSIMETPVYLKKNYEGRGSVSAETATREWTRGAVGSAVESINTAFRDIRKQGVKIGRDEFRQAVGRAMRRGDVSDMGAVTTQEKLLRDAVSKTASTIRKSLFDPLKDEAVSVGLLPPDVGVNTAASYFSRVWNRTRLEAQQTEFKQIVTDWLAKELAKAEGFSAKRTERMLRNLDAERGELEMGILRRQESMRQRMADGEITPDAIPENEVVQIIRRVQAGETAPKVETLSSWLRKQGGIYDPNGDLRPLGIGTKTWPGVLRRVRRSEMNPKGGISLDDLARRAWDEGFLSGTERPTTRELIDALDNDLRGQRVVRASDADKALEADAFDDVMRALDRAGVDFKRPMFATDSALRNIAAKVNKVLDDFDRAKIERLNHRASEISAQPGEIPSFVSDPDREDYIGQIAQDIFDRLTGRGHTDDLPSDLMITERGPLAKRTFSIPDRLIEDFLEDDVELVARRYARVMSADVELSRRFGSPDMREALDDIKADYEKLRDGVLRNAALSPKQKDKQLKDLSSREKADLRDMKAVRDMLRGHYRPEVQHTTWARIGAAANTFNYMRALGGVAVSSLSDAVRPAMIHGLSAYMKDGLGPLISSTKAFKMSAQEAKKAGTISERILASRLATLAEITDPYNMRSPFERFLENSAVGFSRMTGILHWNDFQKSLASVLTQDRILTSAGKEKISAKERSYLAFLGLDDDMAQRVGAQFAAHGDTIDGVKVANTEAWTDPQAVRAYRAAINKDVDSIIVTRGVGDVPLIANTPLGRALLQFRSFALASNQRVLIRGLQEDTGRFVGGLVGMSTIGMFIYVLKQLESGREISDNPGTWVAEGVDRSGIFSVGFEINNALEKLGVPGVYTGAAAAFPDASQAQPASRFAVRSTVGSFLGPSFGGANDVATVLHSGIMAAQGEDVIGGDIAAARRLTPYASLPYWRWLIDGMVVPEMKESISVER